MTRRGHESGTELDAAQVLLRLDGRVSELADLLNGGSVNKVLFVGTLLIGADGSVTRTFRVPFGSVSVANPNDAQLTVVNAPEQDPAHPPTSGLGVVIVGAGGDGTWPITGNVLTIYGPANGQVVLVVTSDRQKPSI
jgi:hypothetical protein